MGLLMKSTPVLILLLAFVNSVAADTRYIGPTVGGILGLVSFFLFYVKNKFLGFFFKDHSYFGYYCCC
jgi:hypothetical protein